MGASNPTKLILAFRSGGRCALPDCGIQLTSRGSGGGSYKVGEAAHIAGENSGKGKTKAKSARFDSSMNDDQRNHVDNLIYLCGTCHTKIDTIPQGELDYPVARLKQIKADHEQKVRDGISDAFAEIGFAELQEATKWIKSASPVTTAADFSLTALPEKLVKNNLGDGPKAIVTMALSVSRQVGDFVAGIAQDDEDFPDKLRAGFLAEYYRLRHAGHLGDELFELMCTFAQKGFKQQAQRSAGLAVLVYLFEACDVFEK